MSATVLVLYNPVSGDCNAKEFFQNHPMAVVATEHAGHAGTIVTDFLQNHQGDVTVVLGSGDGTLHEVVNALPDHALDTSRTITFALVPCGTANALFSSLFAPVSGSSAVAYKLLSLDAFIAPVLSVVVMSTALHASILEDSELLRKEIPGIERFKVAAQQNKTRWYRSRVKLLPVPSTGMNALVPHKDPLDLSGPFAYFLSTVNVDRLEPAFRITPQYSTEPPQHASLDWRHLRLKAFTVLTAAYQDGNHIRLRYNENGNIGEDGNGPTVVEYFRCGGWEWIPEEADEKACLVCSDGANSQISGRR
ncbi:ATP-NAD kinase-like domain-containing protein [Pisolithus marmoratus]|nr:ATP-NAD kinase-like domain-containing protein [Pisolithus marmoratus]